MELEARARGNDREALQRSSSTKDRFPVQKNSVYFRAKKRIQFFFGNSKDFRCFFLSGQNTSDRFWFHDSVWNFHLGLRPPQNNSPKPISGRGVEPKASVRVGSPTHFLVHGLPPRSASAPPPAPAAPPVADLALCVPHRRLDGSPRPPLPSSDRPRRSSPSGPAPPAPGPFPDAFPSLLSVSTVFPARVRALLLLLSVQLAAVCINFSRSVRASFGNLSHYCDVSWAHGSRVWASGVHCYCYSS
jgi:hypothetical protein